MRRNSAYAWLIGIGILLFAIHNPYQPLIQYLFLPSVGVIITVLGVIYCLWDNRKKITFGSKYIWIPLAIITASIVASSFTNPKSTFAETITPALFGMILFGLYLSARILGDKIFKPFTYIVVIESVSLIVYGIINQGIKTGGLASPTNYDMAAGLLVFGVIFGSYRHRWWLVAIALIGLFFTGADEAIFLIVVGGIAVLIRHDWSKKLLLPIGAIVLTIVICTALGITQKLYYPTVEKVALAKEAVQDTEIGSIISSVIPDSIQKPITEKLDAIANNDKSVNVGTASRSELLGVASGFRIEGNWHLSPLKLFGYGLNIDKFYIGIPHNVVLIIIEQAGILAMLAWLFVIGYCLVKTKWKYAFIMLLGMGVFDHYVWTQVGVYYWVLVGVATTSQITTDMIFKGEKVSNRAEVKKRIERIQQLEAQFNDTE